MALFEIKHRLTGAVLFSIEGGSLRLAVEAAVKSGANLGGANLGGVNLRGATLRGANLRDADLREADLRDANLRGANLGKANLGDAKLSDASLYDADLRGADLYDADLRGADLYDANLGDATLRGADLRGTNLRDANLGGANLRGATLRGVDLRGAKDAALVQARTSIVPESGAFEGWKQCVGDVIVHLAIPADAQRSNATGRKCRASHVDVLEILGAPEGISLHDGTTRYRVGARVACDTWDADRWNECSGGIHFYLTRIEAEHHV